METEKRLTILEYSALYPNFASKQSGNEFPFLLKCLSVSKALSIQVHPDKPTAEQLHASDPATYTDPNHKPEMAIALTEFEAMCGFREPLTILNELKQAPELGPLFGDSLAEVGAEDVDRSTILSLLGKALSSPPEVVKGTVGAFLKRCANNTTRIPSAE
eukprot:GHVN01006999.1.p1 GENE.GHVN01006999.1~~GHVN01006999.1.p1  ORF type:complete len:170 (+),score=16.13 GHVN01006999.1:32-511(+)